MASSTPHSIIMERVGDEDILEAPGKGTIYPGYMLTFEGSNGSLIPCGTAGAQTWKVAVENPYDDDTSSAAIDSPYNYGSEKGARVRYIEARRGDLLWMILAADKNVTAFTSHVRPHDDGTLENCGKNVAGGTFIFGQAESTESATTAGTRIKVRVF